MKIIFDKLAQRELQDAIEYYELEVPGLGPLFREEVKRGLRRIREYPDAWAKEKGDVRSSFFTDSRTRYSIQLKRITFTLLRSHIVIDAQITGSTVSWRNPNLGPDAD